MKRLYITHDASDIALAWLWVHIAGFLIWGTIIGEGKTPAANLVFKFLGAEVSAASCAVVFWALFCRAGSRKRREAAAAQGA